MVVLITQKVPASLRGELSRWMIEPRTGVFVGQISAMVRDKLWELACKGAKDGGVILLWSSPTEQGFQSRIYGETARQIYDFEGLSLVHIPHGPLKGNKHSREDGTIAESADPSSFADVSEISVLEMEGSSDSETE